VQALVAQTFANPLNPRLKHLDDTEVFFSVDPSCQPPYPYGFGGLPEDISNPQQVHVNPG
jgi:hypothetical protein